jgi:hypothetical protein
MTSAHLFPAGPHTGGSAESDVAPAVPARPRDPCSRTSPTPMRPACPTGRRPATAGRCGERPGLPGIADHLFISEATVKTHLNRTMTKLGLGTRAQAVVIAHESGLVAPGGLAGTA